MRSLEHDRAVAELLDKTIFSLNSLVVLATETK